MSCCSRFKIPSALIFCAVNREGSGRNNLPTGIRFRKFYFFKVYIATAIPRYWRIIDLRFYVSVAEDFSSRERERESQAGPVF